MNKECIKIKIDDKSDLENLITTSLVTYKIMEQVEKQLQTQQETLTKKGRK